MYVQQMSTAQDSQLLELWVTRVFVITVWCSLLFSQQRGCFTFNMKAMKMYAHGWQADRHQVIHALYLGSLGTGPCDRAALAITCHVVQICMQFHHYLQSSPH